MLEMQHFKANECQSQLPLAQRWVILRGANLWKVLSLQSDFEITLTQDQRSCQVFESYKHATYPKYSSLETPEDSGMAPHYPVLCRFFFFIPFYIIHTCYQPLPLTQTRCCRPENAEVVRPLVAVAAILLRDLHS